MKQLILNILTRQDVNTIVNRHLAVIIYPGRKKKIMRDE